MAGQSVKCLSKFKLTFPISHRALNNNTHLYYLASRRTGRRMVQSWSFVLLCHYYLESGVCKKQKDARPFHYCLPPVPTCPRVARRSHNRVSSSSSISRSQAIKKWVYLCHTVCRCSAVDYSDRQLFSG
jgi:hypothetical protein